MNTAAITAKLDAAFVKLSKATNPCEVAVLLGNAGIEGAVCQSPTRCALAQFFADETGLYARVSGNGYVTIHAKLRDAQQARAVVTSKTIPSVATQFIGFFDSGKYKFLTRRPKRVGKGS